VSALPFDESQIAQAAGQAQMAEWLEATGLSSIHVALVDSSGTLRQKRLGPAAAARAFETGWSFIDAIDWWGPDDDVWRTGGSQHQRARVDTGSGRRNPFERHSALFLAEFEG
jgi:hypothetical protein